MTLGNWMTRQLGVHPGIGIFVCTLPYVVDLVFQSLVTGAVMLSAASCGMPVGYSAILLPQLKSLDNDSMQIDDEMGSWIGMFSVKLAIHWICTKPSHIYRRSTLSLISS